MLSEALQGGVEASRSSAPETWEVFVRTIRTVGTTVEAPALRPGNTGENEKGL